VIIFEKYFIGFPKHRRTEKQKSGMGVEKRIKKLSHSSASTIVTYRKG